MKISREELQNRLSWTLPRKIDHALFTIENALRYSDNNAYVSFSGGKDSTILLYLTRIIKPDIKAVFFNTTNEFPEIYRFIKDSEGITTINPNTNLKQVVDKYGFPLISKEQAQYIREYRHAKSEQHKFLRLNGRPESEKNKYQGMISKKWQHLINAPFEVSEKCCYALKKNPAKIFEKQNKLLPIIGTSVGESSLRKQKYMNTGCNAFEVKRPASYPISIWNNEDKWNFIKENNIPYCEIYDKGETQTGCMICGFGCQHDNRFERLKENHTRAYEIGMSHTNNGVRYDEAINIALKKQKCGGAIF
jgi:3'-phosphoadenosine 5'-phosphosulfate sulfotransferase (PAPS reductase)/FAD synthetase